jgi:GTP pyrophosphokinase
VLLERQRYEEWLDVANHFGLWKLRYLLEDAIFKTFDPDNYALFESVVQKQLFIDEHLVQAIRGIISDALTRGGLSGFSIENRAKNIYGVYRKVALKEKSVNDIYDIHGFRILTATERDCRTAIEILHRLWRHYPERFKDYIAEPKPNGYQSIHTVLNCLENKPIEFQVRTRDMDVVAASGPANHAEYKRTARLSR